MKKSLAVLLLLISATCSAAKPSFVDTMKLCTYYAAKTSEYATMAHGVPDKRINVYVTYVKKDVDSITAMPVKLILVGLAKKAWETRKTSTPSGLAMQAYSRCYKQTQTLT